METPGTGVKTKAKEEVSGSGRNGFGISFNIVTCRIDLGDSTDSLSEL